jgi:ribose transport system substrate-binding protein
MRTVRTRNRPLAAATAALALGMTALLAGCGSATDTPAASAGPETVAEAATALEADLARVAETPSIPAVDASGFAGKTIALIASGLTFTFSQELRQGVEEAVDAVGGALVVTDSGGDPSKASSLIDQAASQGADVILLQGTDPAQVAASIEGAKAMGIPVVSVASLDAGPVPAELAAHGVSANAAISTTTTATHVANYLAADSGGDAKVLFLNSSTFAIAEPFEAALTSRLASLCPGCSIDVQDSPLSQWQTNLQTQVQSYLTAHPDTTYVVPIVDAMNVNVAPAVMATGGNAKIASTNATLATIESILAGTTPEAMDVGSPNTWLGWSAVDQAIRVAVGEPAVDDEQIPVRTFTSENTGDLDLDDPSSWYSDFDFRVFYEGVWGLS